MVIYLVVYCVVIWSFEFAWFPGQPNDAQFFVGRTAEEENNKWNETPVNYKKESEQTEQKYLAGTDFTNLIFVWLLYHKARQFHNQKMFCLYLKTASLFVLSPKNVGLFDFHSNRQQWKDHHFGVQHWYWWSEVLVGRFSSRSSSSRPRPSQRGRTPLQGWTSPDRSDHEFLHGIFSALMKSKLSNQLIILKFFYRFSIM